jgi:hypothetical protein
MQMNNTDYHAHEGMANVFSKRLLGRFLFALDKSCRPGKKQIRRRDTNPLTC